MSEGFLKKIRKFGLKPSVERNLSLFLMSCVGWGYTEWLQKNYGISYKAMAAAGKENYFQGLVNINFFIQNLDKIYKDKKRFYNLRKKALDYFKKFKKSYQKIQSSNAKTYLQFLVDNYPPYFSALGFYNCLWRFLGYQKIQPKLLKELSAERTLIAKLYPQIESELKKRIRTIGRQSNFDGDLLRYLTWTEMKSFLKKGELSPATINNAKKRKNGYFYFYLNRQERVTTDKKIIRAIKNEFLKTDINVKIIKGHAVYPGRVKGNVNTGRRVIKKGDILVTSMTRPEDNLILKKYRAIITNEGGVLTHAAIVAREFKIPCIVGTKIATQVLKDGDLVEVDANKGVVRKINK